MVVEALKQAIWALEKAKNGLQWYQDMHPDDVDGSDTETLAEIDKAIKDGYAAVLESFKQTHVDTSHRLTMDFEFESGKEANVIVYGSKRDIDRLQARIKFWFAMEKKTQEVPNDGWCIGCNPDNCQGCQTPAVSAKWKPNGWTVFNTGACVSEGLTFDQAWDYLTDDRLERGWSAVCVVNKDNLPTIVERNSDEVFE